MNIEDSYFQTQHIEICERSFTKACDEMERLSLEYYRLDVQIREVSSERHMQKQHIAARRRVHAKVCRCTMQINLSINSLHGNDRAYRASGDCDLDYSCILVVNGLCR